MQSTLRTLLLGGVFTVLTAACGAKDQSVREIDLSDRGEKPSVGYQLTFKTATRIWARRGDGLLETRVILPAGSEVTVDRNFASEFPDFVGEDGKVQRPDLPFITPVRVLTVPADSPLSAAEIAALNSTPGGLLIQQPSWTWPQEN